MRAMGTCSLCEEEGDVVGRMSIDMENMQRSRTLDSDHIQEFFKDINLDQIKRKRILEIECGQGKVAYELKKRHNCKVYCIDLKDYVSNEMKKEIKLIIKNATNVKLNDFDDEGFDFIYSFRAFTHLKFQEKLKIIEIIHNNLLKIGGVAIIDFAGETSDPSKISSQDSNIFSLFNDLNLNDKGFQVMLKKYKFDKKLALESAKTEKEVEIINNGKLNGTIQFESFSIIINKISEELIKLI